jgi:hypothetical protein
VLVPHFCVNVVRSGFHHAQSVGQSPSNQNRREKKLKESRQKLHDKSGIAEKVVKRLPAVTPEVASINVFVGPENLISGNCKVNASARAKVTSDERKKFSIVLDVFDDIEQPSGRHARAPKSHIFESGAGNVLNAAALRIAGTRGARFEQDYLKTCILHSLGNESVSASNIEHGSRWWELLHHLEDAGVPVAEPE